MVDSSPWWQIMRQQLPGTATTNGVEDAVQDFPSAVYGRAAARLRHRDERLQGFPFRIGQVSFVWSAARHSCSSAYEADPFQTRSKLDFVHSGCMANCMAQAGIQCT